MPLTIEEIQSNIDLKDRFIELQNEIIATNDKALIANLLDKSGHIIVACDSLQSLIETALDDKVKVEVKEDPQKRSCDCCGKGKFIFQVFGTITSIKLDGKLFEEAEPVLAKFLSKQWNLSLTRTYIRKSLDYETTQVERSAKVETLPEEESDEA